MWRLLWIGLKISTPRSRKLFANSQVMKYAEAPNGQILQEGIRRGLSSGPAKRQFTSTTSIIYKFIIIYQSSFHQTVWPKVKAEPLWLGSLQQHPIPLSTRPLCPSSSTTPCALVCANYCSAKWCSASRAKSGYMTYMTLLLFVSRFGFQRAALQQSSQGNPMEPPFSNSQSLESLDLCFGNLLEVFRSLFPSCHLLISATFTSWGWWQYLASRWCSSTRLSHWRNLWTHYFEWRRIAASGPAKHRHDRHDLA